MCTYIYIYIHTYVYVCVCIYIYICIERERERYIAAPADADLLPDVGVPLQHCDLLSPAPGGDCTYYYLLFALLLVLVWLLLALSSLLLYHHYYYYYHNHDHYDYIIDIRISCTEEARRAAAQDDHARRVRLDLLRQSNPATATVLGVWAVGCRARSALQRWLTLARRRAHGRLVSPGEPNRTSKHSVP